MPLTVLEIKSGIPMNATTVQQHLCKAANKFGLYLGFDTDFYFDKFVANDKHDEIDRATNGRLTLKNASESIREGQSLLLFDTEEEMHNAYEDIVGKDGPTKQNSYDGELRVYAMTISNEGEIWTENC